MASTLTAKVMDAAVSRIATYAAGLPIDLALPNVKYDPVSDTTYLQVDFIPNGNTSISNDPTDNEYFDLLQITVVYPKHQGDVAAFDIAGGVIEHFKSNTKIDAGTFTFRVNGQPVMANPFTDKAWRRLPVTISLQTLS